MSPMDPLDLAKSLIRFPSVSSVSNAEISDQVAAWLHGLAFEVERQEYRDKTGVTKVNILARRGPGTGGIAYFGHTDVVPVERWFTNEFGPFEPTVLDDRLYGRGSCDMKGSDACAIAAASRIRPEEQSRPLSLIFTADEEVGMQGATQVARHSRLFRKLVEERTPGIIGEPTRMEVVYSHKGVYGFRVTSLGKAAHSSTSHGLNANLAMIPFLAEMKRIHDETLIDPQWHGDDFDPPHISWNICCNDNTHVINITPARSVCTVSFRPMPGQDGHHLIEVAREIACKMGLDFEVLQTGQPIFAPIDGELVQSTLAIAGKSAAKTVAYGTDGSMFGELSGMVVFGPGDIAQAHTEDEWIALEQLESGTATYEKLFRHWCC